MLVRWNEFSGKFEVDDATKARMKTLYPFFEEEVSKMEFWYIANPAKRKKNVHRFMVNWLNRRLEQVGVQKKVVVKNEFIQKIEEAKKEATPPPQEWAEMMAKLRRLSGR